MGATLEQASALWDSTISKPGQEKRQLPGDALRLPVMLVPTTRVVRSREVSITLASIGNVESRMQAEVALENLASVGEGAATVTGQIFGEFGQHLRPGVAAGSQASQVLPAGQIRAPPTSAILPQGTFEGPARPKRSLSAQASDPEAGQHKKSKKVVSKALAGVTGDLLMFRQKGLEASQLIAKEYAKGKGQLASKVRGNYKRLNVTMPPEVASLVTQFDTLLVRSKELSKKVSTWTLIEGERGVQEFGNLTDMLDKVSQQLKDHVEVSREQRLAIKADQNKSRLADFKARQRTVGRYRSVVPETLLKFFHSEGAVVAIEPSAGPEEDDADGQPVLAQLAQRPTNRMVSVPDDDEQFDASIPVLFQASCKGVGQRVFADARQFGQDRAVPEDRGQLR